MAVISVNNISKSYDKKVLDNISLSVDRAMIHALAGLNGQGKTTLMRILLGLTSGDVGGAKIDASYFFLPEKYSPPAYLTGYEFIKLNCQYHKSSFSKEKADILLLEMDFDVSMLGKKIAKYSKGMMQKIALASGLLSNVELLILDEPMSGLDPKARHIVKQQLRLFVDLGGTVFFTSHILADIAELADKLSILHGGEIIFSGKSSDIIQQTKEDNLEQAFLHLIDK